MGLLPLVSVRLRQCVRWVSSSSPQVFGKRGLTGHLPCMMNGMIIAQRSGGDWMVEEKLKLPQGNIYAFPTDGPGATSTPDDAVMTLALVQQVADVLHSLHDRVRETEARVQAVAADASEKLRKAEMRVEASEKAYRELLETVDKKLREASAAVARAEANTRIETEKRTAAEQRAEQAEAAARGAMRSLWSVEDAIRKKLLTQISHSEPAAKAC